MPVKDDTRVTRSMNSSKRSSFPLATSHVKNLFITVTQWDKWMHGALIQDAMPGLSAADREFLMTGSTQEEWDDVFGKDDG